MSIYEIINNDIRMHDLTIYENDYNFKCKLVDKCEDGDVWNISGNESDILDFINEYNLDEVATKLN